MLISLLTWKLLFRTVKVFVFYRHVILCCCLNFSFILLNCCQRPCLRRIWLGNFIEISLMTEYMIHFYKYFTNSSTKSHRHLQYFPSQHRSNPIYRQTLSKIPKIYFTSALLSPTPLPPPPSKQPPSLSGSNRMAPLSLLWFLAPFQSNFSPVSPVN